MGARKLTEDQVQQLVAWRERGASYQTIAARLCVSAGAVHYQCLKQAVVSPRQLTRHAARKRADAASGYHPVLQCRDGRTQRRFTADEDRRLVALDLEGKGIAEIATALGRARTSVRIRLMTLAQHDAILEDAA